MGKKRDSELQQSKKTNKLYPKCFRWLRENNETLYCPDTILCQLVMPRVGRGSPPQFTIDKRQEVLAFKQNKSWQYQDLKRIEGTIYTAMPLLIDNYYCWHIPNSRLVVTPYLRHSVPEFGDGLVVLDAL